MRKYEIRLNFEDDSYGIAAVEAESIPAALDKALAGRPDVVSTVVLGSIDLEPQVPLVRFS